LGTSTDLLQLVTSALNLGVLGLVFWLFVGGKLHASSEMEQATADRDQWRKAFEDERTAHQATRESLAVASDRAEAAVEAARVTAKLLEVIQQRKEAG
jgi:hypothetical protein